MSGGYGPLVVARAAPDGEREDREQEEEEYLAGDRCEEFSAFLAEESGSERDGEAREEDDREREIVGDAVRRDIEEEEARPERHDEQHRTPSEEERCGQGFPEGPDEEDDKERGDAERHACLAGGLARLEKRESDASRFFGGAERGARGTDFEVGRHRDGEEEDAGEDEDRDGRRGEEKLTDGSDECAEMPPLGDGDGREGSEEGEREDERGEMMDVGERERDECPEREETRVLLHQGAEEDEDDDRDEEVAEDVADDAAGDILRFRRGEREERTREEERDEAERERREREVDLLQTFLADPDHEDEDGEQREEVDKEEEADREGGKEALFGDDRHAGEGEVLADDEVGDRLGCGKRIRPVRVHDIDLGVVGKLPGLGDELRPVHVMAHVGRGRDGCIREVDHLDEEREREDEREERTLSSGGDEDGFFPPEVPVALEFRILFPGFSQSEIVDRIPDGDRNDRRDDDEREYGFLREEDAEMPEEEKLEVEDADADGEREDEFLDIGERDAERPYDRVSREEEDEERKKK